MSAITRSLLGKLLLCFAALFTAVAISQYYFVSAQLTSTAENQLRAWAEEIQGEIAYQHQWDLAGFRRSSPEATVFYVATSEGLLLDSEGLAPGFLPPVAVPKIPIDDRPITFISAIDERWRLLGHKLRNGLAFLGAPVSDAPIDIDRRLILNAERFGVTLEDAIRVRQRDIDSTLDYAVVDNSGVLQTAAGGIPLSMDPTVMRKSLSSTKREIEGKSYVSFFRKIIDGFGHPVGLVAVFKNTDPEQRVLHQSILFNGFVGTIAWSLSIALLLGYLPRRRITRVTCSELPLLQESVTVEFKSSLRWDYVRQVENKSLEKAVTKTVAAFLNTDGGALVLGLADDRSVLGLERDYQLTPRHNRDSFELTLQQVLSNAIGADRYAEHVRVEFCSSNGKEVCILNVAAARQPVFVREVTQLGPQSMFYVRTGNSTKLLDGESELAYIRNHWHW